MMESHSVEMIKIENLLIAALLDDCIECSYLLTDRVCKIMCGSKAN